MSRYRFYILCALVLSMFVACEKDKDTGGQDDEQVADSIAHETDDDYTYDSTAIVYITLNGSSITINGAGAIASGSKVTIASAGTYSISGALSDGQIIVNTEDEETVKLILNGINIFCAKSSPINIRSAEKTVINLAEGTENYVTDGTSYTYDDSDEEEPNATIFSKSDLTIYGNGSLIVDGNFNDGISSKDGLIIKSGTITVNSSDDGIRGKDYLVVKDGDIKVNAGSNGLKSDNEDNTANGYICVESGTINITSGGDAITAKTNVFITGGDFDLTTGEGSSHSANASTSAKGIKAVKGVYIDCNMITINSADDALHSNGSLSITGGTLILSSADDGIHADESIAINSSEVNITQSYEGIESALITIDNSNIRINATDDGFNATQGAATESNDGSYLNINSGYVYVNVSKGDGLDSNGSIIIMDGKVIVHGPLSQPEVGMDYNGACKISGGTLVISGISSSMTQAPSSSSSQYAVLVKFSSSQPAKSIVHIQDSDGKDVLTFSPVRAYQSIIMSSSGLTKGSTYTVYTGGSSTGTETDGLYNGGNYTGGTSYASFTISGIITTVGSNSGNPGRP